MNSTRNSRIIKASPERLFEAFTDPKALETFLAPGDMHAKVHYFDMRIGGGYGMSLYYPESETRALGKTTGKEDRFTARFTELASPSKIIQEITFHSDDASFSGTMIMQVSFVAKSERTEVVIEFSNIPPGIRPEDNEAGTELALEKLAAYVE